MTGGHSTGIDPNALTTTRAVELINENSAHVPLLQDPNAIKALEQEYQLDQMPEVVAKKQQGRDTSKEALNFDKLEQLQLETVDQANKHVDRRAKEFGVDLSLDEI